MCICSFDDKILNIPEMPECGSITSTVPVVRANLEFFWRDPNDFLSRLVIMKYYKFINDLVVIDGLSLSL